MASGTQERGRGGDIHCVILSVGNKGGGGEIGLTRYIYIHIYVNPIPELTNESPVQVAPGWSSRSGMPSRSSDDTNDQRQPPNRPELAQLTGHGHRAAPPMPDEDEGREAISRVAVGHNASLEALAHQHQLPRASPSQLRRCSASTPSSPAPVSPLPGPPLPGLSLPGISLSGFSLPSLSSHTSPVPARASHVSSSVSSIPRSPMSPSLPSPSQRWAQPTQTLPATSLAMSAPSSPTVRAPPFVGRKQ